MCVSRRTTRGGRKTVYDKGPHTCLGRSGTARHRESPGGIRGRRRAPAPTTQGTAGVWRCARDSACSTNRVSSWPSTPPCASTHAPFNAHIHNSAPQHSWTPKSLPGRTPCSLVCIKCNQSLSTRSSVAIFHPPGVLGEHGWLLCPTNSLFSLPPPYPPSTPAQLSRPSAAHNPSLTISSWSCRFARSL